MTADIYLLVADRIKDDPVHHRFAALEGPWIMHSFHVHEEVGEMTRLELEAKNTGGGVNAEPQEFDGLQGRKQKLFGLKECPPDARKALEAMFELSENCPPDKEAIAEVCQDREDGKRFVVKLRDREPGPDTSGGPEGSTLWGMRLVLQADSGVEIPLPIDYDESTKTATIDIDKCKGLVDEAWAKGLLIG